MAEACNHNQHPHRLKRAIAYAEGKWAILPLLADAKAPLTPTGFKAATQDLEIIRRWWAATPNANIGIATGAVSGIVVIDIDVKNGVNGQESIKAWHELPPTLTASTPTGGYHLYFLYPAYGLRCRTGVLPGVDVKADGGYVVGPGSSIGNKPYEWVDPEVSIAALPESIIYQINAQRHAPAASPATESFSVLPGQRNETLARLAGSLRRKGTDPTEIEAALLAENFRSCTPPLPETEVRTIARSISRYTPAIRPPQAERFKPNVIAEELRQTHNFITSPIDEAGVGVRLWLYKDGVFTPDGETVARRMVHSTLGEESKPERISSVVELLKESTKTDSKHLNPRAAELINVENGMLNWRTGELLPHSPDYLSTVQIQASHTQGATFDIVDKFLREVFPPDALPLAEEIK